MTKVRISQENRYLHLSRIAYWRLSLSGFLFFLPDRVSYASWLVVVVWSVTRDWKSPESRLPVGQSRLTGVPLVGLWLLAVSSYVVVSFESTQWTWPEFVFTKPNSGLVHRLQRLTTTADNSWLCFLAFAAVYVWILWVANSKAPLKREEVNCQLIEWLSQQIALI